MNRTPAIDRNRKALERILAALFAMAGIIGNATVATLPRHLHSAVLAILRPAESAMRRLVVIAAHRLVVPPRRAHAAPALPVRPGGGVRTPAFLLIDPLKPFAPAARRRAARGMPRISWPGLRDPVFIPEPQLPSPDDAIGAERLCRRLHALRRALDDLPGQARRLARWRARRDRRRSLAPHRSGRLSPMRPGWPPGHRKRPVHEIDAVLRECHALALALVRADTS